MPTTSPGATAKVASSSRPAATPVKRRRSSVGRGARAAVGALRARHALADDQVDQPVLVELRLRPRADDPPVAQHRDPVGELRQLLQAVRDVDDAEPLLDGPADQAEQPLDLGVRERRRRLVEEEDARALLLVERPRDRDLRALDGAELGHGHVGMGGETDPRERLARPLALAAPADPPAAAGLVDAAETEVLEHGQLVDEPELLVDEAQSGAPARGGIAGAQLLAAPP